MTSVFIAAAAPALRAGLRAMLEQAGIRVAGEAAQASAFVEAMETGGESELRIREVSPPASPSVLIVAGEIQSDELPDSMPVVVLSTEVRLAASLRSLGLSGWALLPPDAAAEQIVAAVTAVLQGLAVVPVERVAAVVAPIEVSDPLQEPLTPRELEVLQLVSHGLSNKLIARTLSISEHTVKFHVSSTYAKLGAASRTEAVSLAARKGLISL